MKHKMVLVILILIAAFISVYIPTVWAETESVALANCKSAAYNCAVKTVMSPNGEKAVYIMPESDAETAYCDFEIDVPDRNCVLLLNTKKGYNRGIYRVYINGKAVDGSLDLYSTQLEDKNEILDEINNKKNIKLRLEWNGQNKNSSGNIGVFEKVIFSTSDELYKEMSEQEKRINKKPEITHPLYNSEEHNIQKEIYVDALAGDDSGDGSSMNPLKTLSAAQMLVRKNNKQMEGDIVVYLKDGVYRPGTTTRSYDLYGQLPKDSPELTPRKVRETIDILQSDFQLNEQDSGTNGFNVVYRAYPGTVPVISGDVPISGWQLYDADKNIYRAHAKGMKTRNLYVDGIRAKRASTNLDTSNFYNVLKDAEVNDTGIITSDDYILKWNNITDVEFVFVDPAWWAPRVKASSVYKNDEGKTVIELQQPAWYFNRNKGHMSIQKGPAIIENAYELLDEENEWYLDKNENYFYYKPAHGEDINSLNITAGYIEELAVISGSSSDNKIRNVFFEGITFSGTTWYRTDTANGYADSQSNGIREVNGSGKDDENPLAAVTVRYAENIKFDGCTFRNMGSNGLFFDKGSKDCLAIGNNVYDISGTGIIVGGVGLSYRTVKDEKEKIINCDIISNRIKQCAQEYFSGVGISAGMPNDTDISYNMISDCTYSGMHLGWSFYSDAELDAMSGLFVNTKVQNNIIFDVCNFLTDGAPIYTRGLTSGPGDSPNIISGNYLISPYSSCSSAIYNDSGSRYWLSYNNFVTGFCNAIVLNNTNTTIAASDTYADIMSEYIVAGDKGKVPYMLYADGYLLNGIEKHNQTQEIINNAGLLEEYMNLSEYKEGDYFILLPEKRRIKLESGEDYQLSYKAYDIKGNEIDIGDMKFRYNVCQYRQDAIYYQYNSKQDKVQLSDTAIDKGYKLYVNQAGIVSALGLQRGLIWAEGELDGVKHYAMVNAEPVLENNVVEDITYNASTGAAVTEFLTSDMIYDHLIDLSEGEYIEYSVKTPKTSGEYNLCMWAPGGTNRATVRIYVNGVLTCDENGVDFYERNGRRIYRIGKISTKGSETITVKIEGAGKNPNSTGVRMGIYGFEFEKTEDFGNCMIFAANTDNMILNSNFQKLETAANIYNGKMYVPLRALAEGAGATVKWDENTNIASVLLNGKYVFVNPNNGTVEAEGIYYDAAKQDGDHILIALRAVSEGLMLPVDWYEPGIAVVGSSENRFLNNERLIFKAYGFLNNKY